MEKVMLNKTEKKEEALKHLNSIFDEVKRLIDQKLDSAFYSDAIPEEWMEKGNHALIRVAFDSLCLDRPCRMLSETNKKRANALIDSHII